MKSQKEIFYPTKFLKIVQIIKLLSEIGYDMHSCVGISGMKLVRIFSYHPLGSGGTFSLYSTPDVHVMYSTVHKKFKIQNVMILRKYSKLSINQ